jgi:hypothetical protein
MPEHTIEDRRRAADAALANEILGQEDAALAEDAAIAEDAALAKRILALEPGEPEVIISPEPSPPWVDPPKYAPELGPEDIEYPGTAGTDRLKSILKDIITPAETGTLFDWEIPGLPNYRPLQVAETGFDLFELVGLGGNYLYALTKDPKVSLADLPEAAWLREQVYGSPERRRTGTGFGSGFGFNRNIARFESLPLAEQIVGGGIFDPLNYLLTPGGAQALKATGQAARATKGALGASEMVEFARRLGPDPADLSLLPLPSRTGRALPTIGASPPQPPLRSAAEIARLPVQERGVIPVAGGLDLSRPEDLRSGVPFTVRTVRGSGREDYGSVFTDPTTSVNVLGEGRYSSFDRGIAEHYGPNIEELTVSLQRPLVLRNDAEFTNALDASGLSPTFVGDRITSPGEFNLEGTTRRVSQFRRYLEGQGYDGVAVIPEDSDLAQNLFKEFGGSTIIEFAPNRSRIANDEAVELARRTAAAKSRVNEVRFRGAAVARAPSGVRRAGDEGAERLALKQQVDGPDELFDIRDVRQGRQTKERWKIFFKGTDDDVGPLGVTTAINVYPSLARARSAANQLASKAENNPSLRGNLDNLFGTNELRDEFVDRARTARPPKELTAAQRLSRLAFLSDVVTSMRSTAPSKWPAESSRGLREITEEITSLESKAGIPPREVPSPALPPEAAIPLAPTPIRARRQAPTADPELREAQQNLLDAKEEQRLASVDANAPDPLPKMKTVPEDDYIRAAAGERLRIRAGVGAGEGGVPPRGVRAGTGGGGVPPRGPRTGAGADEGPVGRNGIPTLFGRVKSTMFPWEKPAAVAMDLHFALIRAAERTANTLSRAGSKKLREAGLGRSLRGQWAPRPEDIPVLDKLFDALHNPSLVESGRLRVPEGLEQRYEELRQLTDWTEAYRLDFDPQMATRNDYYYRGWKPKKDMYKEVAATGELVWNPAYTKPRNNATYRAMREAGFEPLSWNPYEQWRISHMQGVKFDQQMDLVNYFKNLGDDFIRPWNRAGGEPPRWKTPKVGPAFEGKPFTMTDEAGNVSQGWGGRWIADSRIADILESAYGLPVAPEAGIRIGEARIPIMKVIDYLTFIPKRAKLMFSLFQQADFIQRAGSGSWAAMFNALRTGHPIQSVKHLAAFPPTAADILGSFFVPNWRQGLINKLNDTTPLVRDRPGVTLKSISEAGLNITDPTFVGRDPLEIDKIAKEIISEGRAKKLFLKAPRAIQTLERLSREGLFGGVYPAAIINDAQRNIGPQMIRTYGKELNDEQLSRAIAMSANMRYSSIPVTQSVITQRAVRETLIRIAFSVGEQEGLFRQATQALPLGLRVNKHFMPVPTRGGHFQKFWLDHWIGTFGFLTAVGSIIHFASTGKALPRGRFSPISSDDYGPLPFGYNSEFLSPDLNLPFSWGGGEDPVLLGTQNEIGIMIDTVGQMDTVFKILDPHEFQDSRQSVPIRAFLTQATGEDFYRKPVDEVGPGGVFSRTTHFIQDMFVPIGAQSGLSILAQQFPAEISPLFSTGEQGLGTAGQLLQATGINMRAEKFDQALLRRNPEWDRLSERQQEFLRQELALQIFGPRTRREEEANQERIWGVVGYGQNKTEEEARSQFKRKMDRMFGGRNLAPVGGPPSRSEWTEPAPGWSQR